MQHHITKKVIFIAVLYIVTCLLKAGIAEPEKHPLLAYSNLNSWPLLSNGSVNMFLWQQADNTVEGLLEKKHTTKEELLEVVFCMQSTPRLCTSTLDQNGTAISG
jgi:hypothetical protein